MVVISHPLKAQSQDLIGAQERKSVGGAFLRSIVLPGWGHRYVQDDWSRGRIYLGSEIAFLGATLGYNQQASTTKDAMYTTARQLAGVDIRNRNKAFQLAVAQYNSLSEYNRTMEQTRNWDRFYEVNSENSWEWSSEEDRIRYNNLRGKSDDSRRQAGIFIGLMAVNRVVSGVSSMVSARNHNRNIPNVVIIPDFSGESTGLAAQVTIRF
jgi:hypothetical protein